MACVSALLANANPDPEPGYGSKYVRSYAYARPHTFGHYGNYYGKKIHYHHKPAPVYRYTYKKLHPVHIQPHPAKEVPAPQPPPPVAPAAPVPAPAPVPVQPAFEEPRLEAMIMKPEISEPVPPPSAVPAEPMPVAFLAPEPVEPQVMEFEGRSIILPPPNALPAFPAVPVA